jgi:hypothetical protein
VWHHATQHSCHSMEWGRRISKVNTNKAKRVMISFPWFSPMASTQHKQRKPLNLIKCHEQGWLIYLTWRRYSNSNFGLSFKICGAIEHFPWIPKVLAKHIAQVFYVPDTTNKRLKVVIPGKWWIVGVENDIDYWSRATLSWMIGREMSQVRR